MEVSDLKRRVSRHFFDLVDEDANPLVVALALQDNSSVGLQHHAPEFHELHEELRQYLRSRVEESYQGFNESVGVYRQVVASLKSSHEGIQGTKAELEQLFDLFGNHKPVLKGLHQKSIRYKRKLEILADLETLQQLPSTYEANVARKNFGEARLQLSHALETINSRNLLGQTSVKPFLRYVQTQQTELVTKLVDEMHSTIYLESPYSQKRLEPENQDFKEFIENLPSLPEVSDTDPESNSYAYLCGLTQNLADLQSLGSSLDGLLEKLHQDLHKVLLQTSLEVVKELKLSSDSMHRVAEGQTLLEQFKLIDQGALETLSRSLYNKFTKILEAHRAVTEIAAQYGVVYDLDRVCTTIISTVRSFLLGYTGGEANSTTTHMRSASKYSGVRPRASSDVASRVSRSRHGGPVFEFGPGDEDPKSLRDFETLRESLKEVIPGLLADDPNHLFAETQQQERLEVVAPPHILNIRPLLEPSATFFAAARDIARSENSRKAFDKFLDTFLRKSFVPRLQEAFNDAIDDIAEDETALIEMTNWHSLSQLPIVNCAGKFAETVGLLSQLLDTGTSYREDYATMLVGLLSRIARFFTSQLESLFKSSSFTSAANSASGGSSSGSILNSGSARRMFKVWDFVTGNPELTAAMKNKYKDNEMVAPDVEFQAYFAKRQTPRTTKPLVAVTDLLDVRIFKQATLLITSVRWFILRLRKMRQVASVDSTKSSENLSLRVRRRWTLLDANITATGSSNTTGSLVHSNELNTIMNATAVLAGRCLSEFDGVVSFLEDFDFKSLCSLRADNFLRVVYYFDQMITNRDFHSSNRGEERDPVVDRLQQELSLVSQVFESNLLTVDYKFLLDGIAKFMNELFILEGENINDMNEAGQNQILTNIFALQQMLTSIVSDPRDVDFSRATGFYELFRLNPTLIIEKAREGETDLGLEDLRLLLQIRHRNASGTSTSHAFGTLSSHLSQLNSIFNGTGTPASPAAQAGATTASPTARETPQGASSKPSPSVPVTQTATETTRNQPENGNPRANSVEPLAPRNLQNQSGDKAPQKSRSQLEAEAASRRLREERAKQLAEKKIQREHDAQNAREADKLRQERDALKSRSQESLSKADQSQAKSYSQPQMEKMEPLQMQPQQASQPGVASASALAQVNAGISRSQTSAAPSKGAAKSPLLNHRPRFESAQQPELKEDEQPQIRQNKSSSSLPTVRVNTSLASREYSDASPQTPDQPTNSQERQRTPSERALEAAQRVKVRQLPPASKRS